MKVYARMSWFIEVDVDPDDYEVQSVDVLVEALNANPDAHPTIRGKAAKPPSTAKSATLCRSCWPKRS